MPFAEEYAAKAFATLDSAGIATTGPRTLLFDADAARAAIRDVKPDAISGILLLQVTFTDASMTVEIARGFPAMPLGLWAFPSRARVVACGSIRSAGSTLRRMRWAVQVLRIARSLRRRMGRTLLPPCAR